MSNLIIVSLVMGAVFAVAGAVIAAKPLAAGRLIREFPRNKTAGWILAAICIAWSGWLIYKMPLGGFEKYKSLIYVLIPALFFLIINYMGELLAVRGLGGLLMLLPYPMLLAAQYHESPFRYVIIVMAYIMVIKGMALTLSPYLFRRYAGPVFENPRYARIAGGIWSAFGIFLLIIAVLEF